MYQIFTSPLQLKIWRGSKTQKHRNWNISFQAPFQNLPPTLLKPDQLVAFIEPHLDRRSRHLSVDMKAEEEEEEEEARFCAMWNKKAAFRAE